MTGQSGTPPERSLVADLTVQMARLDERTLALTRDLGALRSEMRTLVGGVYALGVIGFTVLGWLITRAPLH